MVIFTDLSNLFIQTNEKHPPPLKLTAPNGLYRENNSTQEAMRGDQIISAGYCNSLIVDEQGQVYAFGSGVLGFGDRADRYKPEVIPILPSIRGVATGSGYNALLTEDGQVYIVGRSQAVGLYDEIPILKPVLLNGVPPIKLLAANISYLVMVDQQGQLWFYSTNFTLPLRPILTKGLPPIVAMDETGRLFVDHEGQVWSLNLTGVGDLYEPAMTPLNDLPFVVDVTTGSGFQLFLDDQGQVWGFGQNDEGQLGLDGGRINVPTVIPGLPPIKSISSRYDHTLLLDNDGRVWTFGVNADWVMGLDDAEYDGYDVQVILDDSDYDEEEDGDDDYRTRYYKSPMLIPNLENISAVSAGFNHSLVATNDGQVYSFGSNNHGQTGLSSEPFEPTIIPGVVAQH